jgi:cyclase
MQHFYKRVIPVLLLKNGGLYKTLKFKDPVYIGDPMNAVKIFNEKEVDELVFLDIEASIQKKEPDYDLIQRIANECFMPFCYGGGIKTIDQIRRIIAIGVEKVAINTQAEDLSFIKEAAAEFASSSIVVSVDVKKELLGGYKVMHKGGTQKSKYALADYVKRIEDAGAGEIMLNSIDRDGTMTGYDLKLLDTVCKSVSIPVIACGGAGSVADLKDGLDHGATAVAAGSLFVFKGKHRAVLINYPITDDLKLINS